MIIDIDSSIIILYYKVDHGPRWAWGEGGRVGVLPPLDPEKVLPPLDKFLITVISSPERKKKCFKIFLGNLFLQMGNLSCKCTI